MTTAVFAKDETGRRAVAAAAVASLKRFSMLPEVTLRIVEIVRDKRATAADLHRIVSTDPALCMRIMKVVNSAFYGLPQPIASLERAIVVLGGEAIKNIAMAASFGRIVREGFAGSGSSAKALWVHSLAVAAAAKSVAESSGRADPGEAFLCGLLHDVGFLVEMRHDPKGLLTVAEARAGGGRWLTALEDEVYGANHQDFGRALCEHWQLPVRIRNPIGWHDHPLELGEESRATACAVYVADRLAAAAGLGFLAGDEAEEIDSNVVSFLGIGAAELFSIIEALPGMTSELRQVLSA